MKLTKIAITLGALTALAGSNGAPQGAPNIISNTPRLEVRARVCSDYPSTVIVKEGMPIYRVVDASVEGNHSDPVCAPYKRDPVTIPLGIQTGETYASPQACRWARPNEILRWDKADIRPEEVTIENGVFYVRSKSSAERHLCLTPGDSQDIKGDTEDSIEI